MNTEMKEYKGIEVVIKNNGIESLYDSSLGCPFE